MAGLVRLTSARYLLSKSKTSCVCVRLMSGSPYEGGNPPNLTGGIFKNPTSTPPPSHEEVSEWVKKQTGDNWKSLGWSTIDPKIDRDFNSFAFFLMVTVGIVGMIFMFAYAPKYAMNDYYVREAYLLLREREAAGVEPISKNLIDPEKVMAALPSDEELKEAGVVINI